MRIIAGELGGRRIVAPPGDGTRPTSERVREALFGILGDPPPGARVLDLFAGSGALALEALSRGAGSAVLVDASRAAARVARANILTLGVQDRAQVWTMPALRALRRLEATAQTSADAAPFSWVFIDPPYREVDLAARALDALAGGALLAPAGVVAVEHDRRREPPAPARGAVEKATVRRYGDTAISIYRVSNR